MTRGWYKREILLALSLSSLFVAVIPMHDPKILKQHIRNRHKKETWLKRTIRAEFQYMKIQPKTIDLSTRLWGMKPTNSVFIPLSLVLRFILLA